MDWIQTLTIIASVMGSAYYFAKDVRDDIKIQCARTDRLYEMFIQLIKEGKK
jgi:hypothetical protein